MILGIDTEAMLPALRQPSILRAVEELKMLTKTDIERERYESRQKALHDYNTGMGFAKTAGAINAYERLLQLPETPEAQLVRLSADDLTRLAEDLEKRVLKQRSHT